MIKMLFYVSITASYIKTIELHSKEYFILLKRFHPQEGGGRVREEPILEKRLFKEEEQNGVSDIENKGLQRAVRKCHQ